MTVDEIVGEINALPPVERREVLRRLHAPDDYRLRHAKVKIIDHPAKTPKPLAVVHYPVGPPETIDIIETVKVNAARVGHPAVLLAISRWENIIRRRLALSVNDGLADSEYCAVAEDYLRRVGQALFDGASARALSKEEGFALFINYWGLADEGTPLYRAWQILRTDQLRECYEDYEGLKLDTLEAKLVDKEESALERETFLMGGGSGKDRRFVSRDVRQPESESISVRQVIDFLRAKGSENNGYLLSRAKWKAFRNAFYAWRFGLGQETVQQYLNNAKTVPPDGADRFMLPFWMYSYKYEELGSPYALPVVLIREEKTELKKG